MGLYIRTKQERSPQAGFSVCGGLLLRQSFPSPHEDPRRAFFMSEDALFYEKKTGTIPFWMVPALLD